MSKAALPEAPRFPVSRAWDTVWQGACGQGRPRTFWKAGSLEKGAQPAPGVEVCAEAGSLRSGRRDSVDSGLTEFSSEEAATAFPRKWGSGGQNGSEEGEGTASK